MVLTLSYRLRCLLAWDHQSSRAALGVDARVLRDFYGCGAHQRGIRGGRTRMRTVIEFPEKLAALTLRPEVNLLIYSRGRARPSGRGTWSPRSASGW